MTGRGLTVGFFCIWPLIIVSALLFGKGLISVARGRFRGKYNYAAQQRAWVLGGWARVLGVLLMLPFLVGLTNAVVDVMGMTTNADEWKLLSEVLAFVHAGVLLGCGLLALVLYLVAPKSYE